MKQHFFMVSNGSYSDYCVGGLYVCDHAVSDEEWEQHKREIAKFRREHEEKAMLALTERTGKEPVRQVTYIHGGGQNVRILPPEGWYGSPEREEFLSRTDILTQETFIEKHKMTQVEYTEMWDD